MNRLLPILLLAFVSTAPGQSLNNGSLAGPYHFVHLLFQVDGAANVFAVRSQAGTIMFDGAGGFTFDGQRTEGAAAPSAASGAGTYQVETSGFVSLTSPLQDPLRLNARLGDGGMILMGSATFEPAGDVYDAFYAIQAPSGTSVSTLNGNYTGSMLAMPGGTTAGVRAGLVGFSAGGDGTLPAVEVLGHAANISNGVVLRESVVGATYALNADGTGTAQFGPDSSLYSGAKEIFVSGDGNYLLAYSLEPGAQEMLLAIRNYSDNAQDAQWNDVYWVSELVAIPSVKDYLAGTGSFNVTGDGFIRTAERFRSSNVGLDFSQVSFYIIRQDSTGRLGSSRGEVTNMAIGVDRGGPPAAFVYSDIPLQGNVGSRYTILLGARLPEFPGPEPFLSPVGVTNGGSFAPPTYPVSPGEIVSIFGGGMAPQTSVAPALPLPNMLDGVSVTMNGVPAPLFFTSNQQINAQVPFGVTGDTVSVVVDNNGVQTLAAVVPRAETSPGIFTVTQNGIGFAIVTHADFSLVTPQNPARRGETVVFFLTGLGAITPPAPDGEAVPGISRAVDEDNVSIEIAGTPGVRVFAGASPGFVGLYQVNLTIPDDAPLANRVIVSLGTGNAISDFVDIPIGL